MIEKSETLNEVVRFLSVLSGEIATRYKFLLPKFRSKYPRHDY